MGLIADSAADDGTRFALTLAGLCGDPAHIRNARNAFDDQQANTSPTLARLWALELSHPIDFGLACFIRMLPEGNVPDRKGSATRRTPRIVGANFDAACTPVMRNSSMMSETMLLGFAERLEPLDQPARAGHASCECARLTFSCQLLLAHRFASMAQGPS